MECCFDGNGYADCVLSGTTVMVYSINFDKGKL